MTEKTFEEVLVQDMDSNHSRVNNDGTIDIDFKSQSGLDGLLLCSVTKKDLGLSEAEELDLTKPITLTRTFTFHTTGTKYAIFIKEHGWYKRRKYRASTPGYLFTDDIEEGMLYDGKDTAQAIVNQMLADPQLAGKDISIEEISLRRVCDGTTL